MGGDGAGEKKKDESRDKSWDVGKESGKRKTESIGCAGILIESTLEIQYYRRQIIALR